MVFIDDEYTLKARELVRNGTSFFITGKAGTGKTSLLEELVKDCKMYGKQFAITAPTGVAARHAHGVTLHSLLKLPIRAYLPGETNKDKYNLDENAQLMLRKLDILFIDEISMVRCDLMDMIDDVLCHYRKSTKPFGGLQVVVLGDLYQLMPVVDDEDESILDNHYSSPYFFSSDVIRKQYFPVLELKTIYRQDERDFIDMLNEIRDGKLSVPSQLKLSKKLNKRFKPKEGDGFIRITTHNRKAKGYNFGRLNELDEDVYEYRAWTEGYIPKKEEPTNYKLLLKEGARVMFVRNDNEFRHYNNGTLGTVIELDDNEIWVKTDEGITVNVERYTWDFYKYEYDKKKHSIEQTKIGSFCQYPLKLAWAITIHKSQGLTFDRVVIDAGQSFAPGQVYVALSRCRSFGGIVLASEIKKDVVTTDPGIKKYMQSAAKVEVNTAPVNRKSSSALTGPAMLSCEDVRNLLIYPILGKESREYLEQQIVKHGRTVDQALESLKRNRTNSYNFALENFNSKYPSCHLSDFKPGYKPKDVASPQKKQLAQSTLVHSLGLSTREGKAPVRSRAGKKWTKQELNKVSRLYREGNNVSEISRLTGRSTGSIITHLNELFDSWSTNDTTIDSYGHHIMK